MRIKDPHIKDGTFKSTASKTISNSLACSTSEHLTIDGLKIWLDANIIIDICEISCEVPNLIMSIRGDSPKEKNWTQADANADTDTYTETSTLTNTEKSVTSVCVESAEPLQFL